MLLEIMQIIFSSSALLLLSYSDILPNLYRMSDYSVHSLREEETSHAKKYKRARAIAFGCLIIVMILQICLVVNKHHSEKKNIALLDNCDSVYRKSQKDLSALRDSLSYYSGRSKQRHISLSLMKRVLSSIGSNNSWVYVASVSKDKETSVFAKEIFQNIPKNRYRDLMEINAETIFIKNLSDTVDVVIDNTSGYRSAYIFVYPQSNTYE